jgi:hypothetical protein
MRDRTQDIANQAIRRLLHKQQTGKSSRTLEVVMRNKKRQLARLEEPFIGCDGEGGGVDELGRQNYRLFRMGDNYLFQNNERLKSHQILNFMLDQPSTGKRYVSYAFDYDVTMICRDLELKEQKTLVNPRDVEYDLSADGKQIITKPFAMHHGFKLRYLPRKYFQVSKYEKSITIEDCFSFFQSTFLKALIDWDIGTDKERALIQLGKESRTGMDLMGDMEISYNAMECRLLADLMSAFRTVCNEHRLTPSKWQGPGLIAQKLMQHEKVPKNTQYKIPPMVQELAHYAYFGGRFETTRTGHVPDVYEYDINSAYPHAMLDLPCLLHGTWKDVPPIPENIIRHSLVQCRFYHDRIGNLCNLPFRRPTGAICWPSAGQGAYWGLELIEAMRAGTTAEPVAIWQLERNCECNTFEYVIPLYEARRAMGKATRGYALKLALNSQYGKLAQSIGNPRYANAVWAGLITATTRALLIRAARQSPDNIVMLATDGIYSTAPLDLDMGSELGQWEAKRHPHMFIVQPGVYFGAGAMPKSRGVNKGVLAQYEDKFTTRFDQWMTEFDPGIFDLKAGVERQRLMPHVSIPLTLFVGLRSALHRNKPDEAGCWKTDDRHISFDFRTKRRYGECDGQVIYTKPLRSSPNNISMCYNKRIGGSDVERALYGLTMGPTRDDLALEHDTLMEEGQPDGFSFGTSIR